MDSHPGGPVYFWALDQDQGRAEGPDPTKHPDPASLEIRGLGLAENSAYLISP